MNFQELMQRMAELDQPVIEEPNEGNAFSGALDAARDAGEDNFEVDGKTYKVKEDGSFEEACGLQPPGMSDMPNGMMGMRSGTPPQPDSINANVSLNASGKGGIRDLMDILRNIDGEKEEMPGFGDADADVIVKKMSPPMGLDDDFDNAPDEIYQGIDAVTRTGGDLHSKGIEKPAVAGGGNPMAVESLKEKLQSHYNRIKEG